MQSTQIYASTPQRRPKARPKINSWGISSISDMSPTLLSGAELPGLMQLLVSGRKCSQEQRSVQGGTVCREHLNRSCRCIDPELSSANVGAWNKGVNGASAYFKPFISLCSRPFIQPHRGRSSGEAPQQHQMSHLATRGYTVLSFALSESKSHCAHAIS